jgi:predicted nucleotidyltransferase
LPSLVDLGILERREAPPSALFRFVPEHVAARAIVALADARQAVLEELASTARDLVPRPASVIVFGSFARAEAVSGSDVDIVVVRSDDTDEEDASWRSAVAVWTEHVHRVTGNPVELLEVSTAEVSRLLHTRKQLWLDVQRDGVVVFGADLALLKGRRSA